MLKLSVWLDVRTRDTVDDVLRNIRNKNINYLQPLCGLPISTYFSALKLKWMIDNVPEVKEGVERKTCLFGTVDSWLIWVNIIKVIFSIKYKTNKEKLLTSTTQIQ